MPFARTGAEREANGDPRLSIDERYDNRAHYLGLVAESAMELIDDGYLLGQDLPTILGNAEAQWNFLMGENDN